MGQFVQGQSQGSSYNQQAQMARVQGLQQKREAYQKAYSLEDQSAKNSYLAMQNMMAARQNQHAAVASELTRGAGSGFMASTGTMRRNQQGVAEIVESAIANMNMSNVISDENARMQANQYRAYGDQALTMTNIQADYYSKLAKTAKKASWWGLVGDIGLQSMSLGLTYGGGRTDSTDTQNTINTGNPSGGGKS
ncbi:MAG: hypothetical protein ACI4O9_02505 [Akkermansia sp.]